MTQQSILARAGGAFDSVTRAAVEANFTDLYAGLLQVGTIIYLDAANGNDSNTGYSPAQAKSTLAGAYALATSGKNDVIVIVGDGGTSASVRISSAFTFSKDAVHVIGVAAPTPFSPRARIATTGSDTAFTPFVTISGNGCIFQNVQFWHGFDTGTTACITAVITGNRNYFKNCHFAGMADDESAQSATSRVLKIGGGGENFFERCVVGVDTATRTVANASVEFVSGSPRNIFKDCIFPFQTSADTPLGFITAGAAAMDRYQYFINCHFINGVDSSSTAMAGLSTLAAASGGGLYFHYSTLLGITEYGSDAASLGQILTDGGNRAAATTGIAIQPS